MPHTITLGCLVVMLCTSSVQGAPTLVVEAVDREPRQGRDAPDEVVLGRLRAAVAQKPGDRGARFELVTSLVRAAKLDEALKAARLWRQRDAYNLVVVRLIGDILREQGQLTRAMRSYSAVVELLPREAEAQRALAMVLKQSGALAPARQRLLQAMVLRPEDQRIAFELADVTQRMGQADEAAERFRTIIASDKTPAKIRYPAKQRLAQLLAARRRQAVARGDSAAAAQLGVAIDKLQVKGGVRNHIKVYLTWDTDRTDVDLWITNPAGEKVYYQHKEGKFGGALFDDVTDGYGPESFTARRAARGTYLVQVHFYGTGRRSFTEARGEVVLVLNEGSAGESRRVLPYRLFKPKQVVTVARVRVRPGRSR